MMREQEARYDELVYRIQKNGGTSADETVARLALLLRFGCINGRGREHRRLHGALVERAVLAAQHAARFGVEWSRNGYAQEYAWRKARALEFGLVLWLAAGRKRVTFERMAERVSLAVWLAAVR